MLIVFSHLSLFYSLLWHSSISFRMFYSSVLKCAQSEWRPHKHCQWDQLVRITNGVINTSVATFFVWLYWNKLLLFTDELCAYWYRSINNYWSLCLVKFHQASLSSRGEIHGPQRERERKREDRETHLYSMTNEQRKFFLKSAFVRNNKSLQIQKKM